MEVKLLTKDKSTINCFGGELFWLKVVAILYQSFTEFFQPFNCGTIIYLGQVITLC